MANWSNMCLVVTGRPADLATFRRAAGALEGRIETKKSSVFTEEMEIGEGGDLEADRARVFRRVFRRASYRFQGANTDYRGHFVGVSRRFPAIAFVLVFSDPNFDEHGSYLISRGRARVWRVPRRTEEAIQMKHYRAAGLVDASGDVDYDSDDAFWPEWEAFFEMMDVAADHWDDEVVAWLKKKRQSAL
jgi:hypothetical protein